MADAAAVTGNTPAPPWMFALLGRASAVLQGFVQIVFPYVAVHRGLSVAAVASVVSASYLALTCKLFWSPVLDMMGTLRGWSIIGGLLSMLLLLVLTLAPISSAGLPLLLMLAFACSTAAQVAGAAAGGLLVLTVPDKQIGAASAYYQGGDLLTQGLSGGIGLWIATRFGLPVAAAYFSLAVLPTFLIALLIKEPYRAHIRVNLVDRIKTITRDVIDLGRYRRGRWVMLMFLTPIGAGATSFLWAAIAPDWHTNADQVAATTGAGAAIASAVGAFIYGRFLDRFERTRTYMLISVAIVGAALLLAILPRTPTSFAVGTMIYTVLLGCVWTSFGTLQYETVGGGAAATKNALLNAMGNIPIVYMPVLLGLVHDHWSTTIMLLFEVVLTSAFIVAFAIVGPGERRLVGRPVIAPA